MRPHADIVSFLKVLKEDKAALGLREARVVPVLKAYRAAWALKEYKAALGLKEAREVSDLKGAWEALAHKASTTH